MIIVRTVYYIITRLGKNVEKKYCCYYVTLHKWQLFKISKVVAKQYGGMVAKGHGTTSTEGDPIK